MKRMYERITEPKIKPVLYKISFDNGEYVVSRRDLALQAELLRKEIKEKQERLNILLGDISKVEALGE